MLSTKTGSHIQDLLSKFIYTLAVMQNKVTQDEGRLQFAQVSLVLFCDLHGPKRKELKDVFKSITCNFHCHDKTASALAQGRSLPQERVRQARQGPGEDYGDLTGISLGTIILQSLDTQRHLACSTGMAFSFDSYLNSETRDTGPNRYFLRIYKYLRNDISWSISVNPSTVWRRLT